MHHFPLSRSHHRRETTTIVAASRILRLSLSEAVCARGWGTGVRPLFGEFTAGVFKGSCHRTSCRPHACEGRGDYIVARRAGL